MNFKELTSRCPKHLIIQTVYQPEILSSCGYSTCKDFQCTLVGLVLEKKSEVVKLSKKPFGQTLFSFFLFVCFLLKESHMIIILLPSFLVRFFLN